MNCTILGSGSWGSALAQVLADNGHQVMVYGISRDQVDDINLHHQNKQYYGEDVFLNPKVKATTDLEAALKGGSVLIISVPSNAVRSLLKDVAPLLKSKKYFVNTAKGIEKGSDLRMSEIIREIIPASFRHPVVSLIGPSHAEEVVRRQVTAISATSKNIRTATKIQNLFSNNYFRVYTNKDEIGAEIAAAMKNPIAIASGVLAGLGYGDNARAALITRGLHEMSKFGTHFGAKKDTFLGLTGLGDLVVTCNSTHSRNFNAGFQIGQANSAASFFASNKATVEGVYATEVIYEIAGKKGIELPIIKAVYEVLFNNGTPSEQVLSLMTRPLKDEKEK